MAKIIFDWDVENSDHVARHGISTTEAESVVTNPRNDVSRSRSSGMPITFGRTKTGKYLAVVWVQTGSNPTKIRVVTAYEVEKPEGRP